MRRKLTLIMLVCLMMLAVAACTGGMGQNRPAEATTSVPREGKKPKSTALVVYFSRVGNSDFPEDVDVVSSASLNMDGGELKGNAQMIAEYIAEEENCETFEIVSAAPYPAGYDETVEQAKSEQSQSTRPALKGTPEHLEDYKTIYLVLPVWWDDMPMPVYSFLDSCDLSGKKVKVFITHEGSDTSNIIDRIKELEPDAKVREGLSVRGSFVINNEDDIRDWVKDHKKK